MKILSLISDHVTPPTNATRVRNLFLWPEITRQGNEIKILGLDSRGQNKMQKPIVNVSSHFFPFKRQPLSIRAINSFRYSYHQWPFCNELAKELFRIEQDWQPDVIHAEELRMAAYLPCLQNRKTKAVQTVSFHNVESALLKKTGSTPFKILKPLIEAMHLKNLKDFERKVINSVDFSFAYSGVDLQKYLDMYASGKWETTSGGVNIHAGSADTQVNNNSILIVGSLNYAPNIDGLHWFINFVLPLLQKDIQVSVAGSNASIDLKRTLLNHNIKFVDTPEDLTSIYKENAISLVPLLSGSGTRGRILESIAHGRVVVTTTVGIEGLDIADRCGVLIADSPQDFASAILYLLNHSEEKKQIAQLGLNRISATYSWPIVAKHLVDKWQSWLKK